MYHISSILSGFKIESAHSALFSYHNIECSFPENNNLTQWWQDYQNIRLRHRILGSLHPSKYFCNLNMILFSLAISLYNRNFSKQVIEWSFRVRRKERTREQNLRSFILCFSQTELLAVAKRKSVIVCFM